MQRKNIYIIVIQTKQDNKQQNNKNKRASWNKNKRNKSKKQ